MSAHLENEELPPDFGVIELTDKAGRLFKIISDRQPDFYEDWLIKHHPYSPIAHLIRTLLKGHGSLIDVGANIGTISIPVAQDGNKVLAVELLPINCLKLVLAQKTNSLDSLLVFQGAATDGERVISYSGGGPWAAIVSQSSNQAAGYRLDLIARIGAQAFPEFLKRPLFIKIDVEGHELEVLRGAVPLIDEFRPYIVFESQVGLDRTTKDIDTVNFLRARGYELFVIHDFFLLSPHPKDRRQEPYLVDFFAIPSERVRDLDGVAGEFEIRELTIPERIYSIKLAAYSTQLLDHQVHAIKTIARWQAEEPELALASADMIVHLKSHGDPGIAQLANDSLK